MFAKINQDFKTKKLKLQNQGIEVTDYKKESDQMQIHAKIVLIDMEKVLKMYLCPVFNYQVDKEATESKN